MPTRNMWKKLLLLMLLSIQLKGVEGYAQQPSSQQTNAPAQPRQVLVSEDLLKEAEKAFADNTRLRATVEAQKIALDASDREKAALRGLLQVQELISEDWKKSALSRKDALAESAKLTTLDEKRVAKLEADLDSARKSRNMWAIGSFLFGAVVTAYLKK